jgi:hypothetical protein
MGKFDFGFCTHPKPDRYALSMTSQSYYRVMNTPFSELFHKCKVLIIDDEVHRAQLISQYHSEMAPLPYINWRF